MSFEALAAVDAVEPPSSTVLVLLYILASYAGPDGSCFVSQETLATRAKLSLRCVRDNLKLAEKGGLIRQTERRRRDGSRTSNTIWLIFFEPKVAPEQPTRRARRPKLEPQDVVQQPAMVAGSQPAENDTDNRQPFPSLPAPAAGLTTFEPVTTNQECSDEHSLQASASADDRFDEAWSAYPISGVKRSSEPASREAWRTAVANGGANGEARLVAAVKAFAADPDLKRGDFGAPAFQRWLGERRFLSYLATVDDAASLARAPISAGVPGLPPPPAALRDDFEAVFGNGRAASYWPVGWIEPERRLVARTGFARDWLQREAADWLAAQSITVISAAELANAQPSSGSKP